MFYGNVIRKAVISRFLAFQRQNMPPKCHGFANKMPTGRGISIGMV